MKKDWNRKEQNTFLIALGGLLAGATVTYFLLKKKKETHHQKPPKGAPQLKIENPGSQDDFPKPPMESEVG